MQRVARTLCNAARSAAGSQARLRTPGTERFKTNSVFDESHTVFKEGGLGPSSSGGEGPSSSQGSRTFGIVKRVLGTGLTAALAGVGYVSYFMTFEEAFETFGREGTVAKKLEGTLLEVPVAWLSHQYLLNRARIEDAVVYFADPSSDKLLPPLHPQVAPHAKTLVLDLDGVLVKSDWNRERGWRTFKRPGVDAFLKHLSQFYEIVVFTDQLPTYGEPVLDRIDPQRQYISSRLYRDATRYTNGAHVRDLSMLNRAPEKIIYLSAKPESYQLQPENAFPIAEWKDLDQRDTALLDLMPLLESLARRQVPDFRTVIVSYKEEQAATGKAIAEIFRERSQQMQEWLKQREGAPRGVLGRLGGRGGGGAAPQP